MTFPVLAGYKINKEFASGGMAKIYDAIQVSLNRPVAIKFLSKQLLSHFEAKALFERESMIIAQLNHPNIVQIIDKGISDESQPYFVMEKIIGIDLSDMLDEGEIPFNKKLDVAIQICKGLAYAHKNGVIHRDIKPSNIIIDHHGDARILDFGIALTEEENAQSREPTSVLGTQGYVAPEQQEDYSNATIASDIYSVGVLFYDLFGSPAVDGQKIVASRLGANVPSELKALIEKCCHPNAAHRYPTLTQVRDELLRISQGSHLTKSRLKAVENENRDLINNFILLDVLSQSATKRVLLFQKKSNKQLLVIRRSIGDLTGLKEAKLFCSLKHPNIINIFAAVKNNSNSTIISEYLSGGSLSNQMIQDYSESDFLSLASKIASAIDFAHQNNILHSNLSPSNILFDEKQNLKIGDFGQTLASNDNPNANRAYIPPTQQDFSVQYDIYCMGAIFHHMLFGVPPKVALPPDAPKYSFRLQKLIDRMLALNPLDRPASAQEVYVELQRIYNSEANLRFRSKISEARDEEQPLRRKSTRRIQQKQRNHTLWLSVALAISIVVNILLVAKFLVK